MSPERDHSIDVARAVAMAGVVGGHWLVTGLRIDGEGTWRQASPLAAMPDLAPVSWVLQTLGLFFFAGGFAAARAGTRGVRSMRRLVVPLAALLGFWAAVLGIAAAAGTPTPTLRTIAVLVISPLWFLLPYLVLRAGTTPLAKIVARTGPWVIALPAVGVVAVSDLGLAPVWLAVLAAWTVPWVLGVALARGRVRCGLGLLLAGAGAMAVLIGVGGYPVSAVGVPGEGRSNLSPPSLVAVALALAQIGGFLLVRDRLSGPPRRLAGRSGKRPVGPPVEQRVERPGERPLGPPASRPAEPPASRPAEPAVGRLVGLLNRAALPIFLCHQSVLIVVTATASAILGRPAPGLLTAPADPWWIMQRLAWLPFLALVLAAVIKPRRSATRRARLP